MEKKILFKPLALEYLNPITTISPKNAIQDHVQFSINDMLDFDAPPMLNAFEIYKLEIELSSQTNIRDGIL